MIARGVLSGLVVATICFGAAATVLAQPSTRTPRVGFVALRSPDAECKPMPIEEAFFLGLRDVGYVVGQTIVVDLRCVTTDAQRAAVLNDFIRTRVDVIVVIPPAMALAARNVTKTVPIVCGSCGDPVDNGLAVSLARPGTNVTGLASLSAELIGKRVEITRELLPGLRAMTVFVYPTNPGFRPTLNALDAAGRALGIEMRRIEIRTASDFEKAFQSAAAAGARAVLLQDDPINRVERARIAELGLKHRLPTFAGVTELAEAGALLAYAPDRSAMLRRAAIFVDKILKGATPADLPFEQATRWELTVNLRTAKALGMTMPASLLLRADTVIE